MNGSIYIHIEKSFTQFTGYLFENSTSIRNSIINLEQK